MTGFASQADLEAALGKPALIDLTDRNEPRTGDVDSGVIAAALATADATINAYVPSAPDSNELLKSIAVSLASHELHSHLATIPEAVSGKYNNAMKMLRDIQAGRASLGTQPQQVETPGGAATVSGAPGALSRSAQSDYLSS